ncbi:lysophospholipase [filamentous cyanobacterium CCP5]|nr:lysophospholipase [filamentous cyanobacterium CCP5]
MKHLQDWFSGSQGLDLYYQSWQPETSAKADVVMLHGLGSHSGWFMNLIEPLVAAGYGIHAFDLRGHGLSPGPRGHVDRWSDYRNDLHTYLQLIRTQPPERPCFALGHSLGGMILLEYALHYPDALSGLIALAPALGSVGVSPFKLLLGQILSWAWPTFTLDTGLDHKAASRDRAVILAYETDPLRHTQGTARLATEFLKTRRWVRDRLSDLRVPTLFLHGSSDPVVLPEGGRMAFDRIQIPDKEYREYPQGYHDLHNDICAPTVVRDILYWLERHVQSKPRFCPIPMS